RGLHPRRGGAPGAGRLGGGAPAAYAPRSRVPRGHRRDEASRLRHARAERHRLVPALEEGLFPRRRPDDASARARLLGRRIALHAWSCHSRGGGALTFPPQGMRGILAGLTRPREEGPTIMRGSAVVAIITFGLLLAHLA